MSRSHRLATKGPERRARYTSRQEVAVHNCPACGKRTYNSKKAAKAVIERAHKGEPMNVYRCKGTDEIHIGHVSPMVRAGILTRSERYGT